ncbi:selenocysteine insertion sequence-binding protein 2 isoform X3 [Xiphophorus couchianus]|uniref:selenocysteine insertion sequence-binding protein 2 isoform X3 n=1 Tax=Xiphophorus couchianus TaxID=32473 RepID=UPI001016EC00|nr:selenocysteine insertion sequence-binding protein 2 isoform X3 [Xiphophorus couchianus]
MEKESKPTPSNCSPQDFEKHPKKRSRDASDPHTASVPVVLPNPYVSNQTSARNWTDLSQKQAGKRGDVSRSHGYSSRRPVRETSDKNKLLWDPHSKTSKSSNDSQGRNVGKNSADARQKAGFRHVRSAPASGRKSTPALADFVPFEVKMADFPELAGILQKSTSHAGAQKDCWGPSPQCTNPQTQTTSQKAGRNGSTAELEPLQNKTPINLPAQPVITSWANIASQPPKKPVVTDETIRRSDTQTKCLSTPQEEGGPGKKKRKRKKKSKSNAEDAEAESGSPLIHHEPPKFEDEEEFPDLVLGLTGLNSKTKLCKEENQREGGQYQSADLNKEKSPVGKTQLPEITKKGQKAEKVSGKKSKAPVQLDIGNMLAVLEKKQQTQKSKQDSKPIILSVGGGLPVVQKQSSALKKPPWQQDKIAHNPLDSTSPLVKKGKQREVPKAKKPTPLKKVILKEREEKKQRRLLEERGLLPDNGSEFTNDAAEEQHDSNDTEDIQSLTQGFDEQLNLNGTNSNMDEADEDNDKNDDVQQEVPSSEPQQNNVPKIHSRKFRDYCSQMLRKDLDECVTSLLKELVRFQDRLYQKDPMKARMKRRIVMGLREVLKHLKLKKVKCVIISPNCERIQSKGGLDEVLHTIINMCREQGVPFVFALSRKALGHCVNKAVPVSLVGIFNYDGAQDFYHKMIELSAEARRAYEVMLLSLERSDQSGTDQQGNTEPLQINSLAEESEPGPDSKWSEKPHYLKFWEQILEEESSHAFLSHMEQLLDSECTENAEEDKS